MTLPKARGSWKVNARAWEEMTADERKYVQDVEQRIARATRQLEHQRFADQHDLKCFKCQSGINAWAKTGKTNGRAWGICIPCVRRPK